MMPIGNLTKSLFPSRLSSQLVAGAVLVNLFMMITLGLILYQSHHQYQQSAEKMTQSLAHVLEENFSGLIDKIDVSMLAVSDEMQRQYAGGGIDAAALDRFLERREARLPQIDNLRVVDEHGLIRYGLGVRSETRVNVSDRGYYIYLKAHDDNALFVSEPVFARINKKWSLLIARRLNHPDGSFAGVIYALIALDKISASFSHLAVGEHGTVNLMDGGWRNIVRYPSSPDIGEDIGKQIFTLSRQARGEAGTGGFRGRSVLDDVERTYAFRKISAHPLYVSVGFAEQDYLAEWRDFSIKLSVLMALFVLLTSYAVRLLLNGEKIRGEAEQSLQVLNRDFITLLESTTDFIYFKDRDSRIRFCSQTLAEITGHRSWRDMIGKHDREIFPEETARVYIEEELQVFRDGTPVLNRIDPYYDSQGRQGWVSTNKWPVFDQDGRTVIGVFGISRDISEFRRAEIALRESEQRFRTMFHKNASIMLLIDPQSGEIVDANRAAAEFYGYAEEELRGMPISRINRLSDEEVRRERMLALEGKRNHFAFSHQLANKEVRTVEVYSTPIEDGGRTLLFSILYDITERNKAEEALKHSNADLERFAYSVSHDMRQPLRAISGHLQLLQRSLQDKLDQDERENMRFALEGAQRMDSMIVSLLEYSRVGRKTESKQWIASRGVFDEALGFLAPMVAETQTQLKVNGTWPEVFASRDELMRLLQNLVGNAIKFHETGRAPQVEIDSSVQDNTWRVSVQDHGVGINPQHIDRLFQFFSRLQSRARFEGTGMGLALCRRIVEHHNGRIWAESDGEGRGSAFIFELPIKQLEGET